MDTFYKWSMLIIAIAAIVSPVITTFITKRNELKIARMNSSLEFYKSDFLQEKEIFDNFLGTAGSMISYNGRKREEFEEKLWSATIKCFSYLDDYQQNTFTDLYIIQQNYRSADPDSNTLEAYTDQIKKCSSIIQELLQEDKQKIESKMNI